MRPAAGHFNLAQGIAVGIGASLSTTLAGFIADSGGPAIAFLFLSTVGATGLLVIVALMPETREVS